MKILKVPPLTIPPIIFHTPSLVYFLVSSISSLLPHLVLYFYISLLYCIESLYLTLFTHIFPTITSLLHNLPSQNVALRHIQHHLGALIWNLTPFFPFPIITSLPIYIIVISPMTSFHFHFLPYFYPLILKFKKERGIL